MNAQNSLNVESESLTADAGDARVIEVGHLVRLDGSDSTINSGFPLNYNWSLVSQPQGSVVTLSDANSARPSFTPDVPGDYRAELFVSDSTGLRSSAASVLLTTENIPPVAMAGGDKVTSVGRPIRLDPEGTFDANGDRLEAVWSIIEFPSETLSETDDVSDPTNSGATNVFCPTATSETTGTYHAVGATSQQQSPHLAIGQPLAEGTTETGSNSATTYYGPVTMDLTGDASIFVPAGEVIEIALSSAWGASARAEILMSLDGENYTSLGTAGNGGSVYGTWTSNILRYDDFVVPAGGIRFLQVLQENGGVRVDGVIYQTQCSTGDVAASPQEEEGPTPLATLEEDDGGRFVFTPSASGQYLVQVTVTDTQGAQSTDVASIYVASEDGEGDVTELNIAPVADAGRDQLISVDQVVSLDGTGSTDINGDRLSYRWSILSRPEGSFSIIENVNGAITRFTPDMAETYILQLAVTDESGLTAYDTVTLSGDVISSFALSGGPIFGADGAISGDTSQVNAQSSQSGEYAYTWSVLGLSDGQSEVESPNNQTTNILFGDVSEGEGSSVDGALAGVEFLQAYSLISFGNLDSNVDTAGRTLVGGNVVGESATFATRLQSQNGMAVLEVVGNIYGGPKNINGGGDVHVGGSVSSHLNMNGGGQVVQNTALDIESVRQAANALSDSLAQLTPNSDVDLPSSQPAPARLIAQPDENGVAVFDIPNGEDLFNNYRVQQIELIDNGATSIIFNIGGADIQFNHGNFVGSIGSDQISQRIIWNFHEAVNVQSQRKIEGSVLAPHAFFHNQTEVDGSVVAERVLARGRIGFPTYSGAGVSTEIPVEETKYALVQLAVTDPENPEVGPSYDTTVLTTGNRRPVAIAGSSNEGRFVSQGSDVTLTSSGSFDADSDQLEYHWAILSSPAGSEVDMENNMEAAISVTADASGTYIFQLIVSDGQLMSEPDTVSFTVENTVPVADAGDDQTVSKGDVILLTGLNSSDFDGDELSYAWVFSELPNGSIAELENADTATPSFEADIGGNYIVTLVVSDGYVNSAPDTVTITIENAIPLADISGPETGFAGDVIMLSGRGSSDPDGDTLSYSWSLQSPEGSSAELNDVSAAMPTYTPDIAGTFIVTLIVNDGEEPSLPVSLETAISTANRPPVLDSVGDRTVSLGSTLGIQLSAEDPDGDNVVYDISPLPLPSGASFDVNTGIFSFRPSSLVPESFSVSFGVSDGELRDSETIVVSIDNLAESTTTQYSGQVVDAITGEGIEGLLVQAGSQTATTNANGEFILTDLLPGQISIWIVGDENTELAANGQPYAPTQIAATLFEDVNNQEEYPIRLSTVSASGIVTPGEMITVSSSTFGVSLEVPADAISDMATNAPYSGQLSISSISPEEANSLPPNIVPCQLFSLAPKTVRVTEPVTLTVDNYDNLTPGEAVDVWAFNGNSFNIIGSGQVNASGDRVSAQISNLDGGQLIALAPRPGQVKITSDQPGDIYTPGLLNEGNFSTSYSTQSYSSLGVDRALTFVYNSTSATPAPIISSVSTLNDTRAAPESVSQMVRVGDAILSLQSNVDVPTSQTSGFEFAQSGTFDASALASGTYPVSFISVNEYACSKVGAQVETEIVVNNLTESPIGTGWNIAELSRLVVDDTGRAQIIYGNGKILEFSPEQALGSVRDTFIADVQGDNVPIVSDIDGNGTLDVVAIDGSTGELRFFLNDGNGNLAEDVASRIVVGRGVETLPRPAGGATDFSPLRFADFNNDGMQEFAIYSTSRLFIQIISKVGDSYEITDNIRLFNAVRELQISDFNDDGYLDIVTLDGVGQNFFLNDGTGGFLDTERQTPGAMDMAVADIDGDGRPDVVMLSTFFARIRFNEGGLSFREVRADIEGSANRFLGQLVQTGDVDLDGDIDFVVSSIPNPTYIENLGNRIFRSVELEMPDGFANADNITLADVTGDGLLDVIADERTPQPRYAVFTKLAVGDFEPAEVALIGHPIGESLVLDVDEDGFQDLISKSRFNLFVDFGQAPEGGNFNSPFGDFTTLIRNDDGTFSRRFTNGSVVTYNAQGLQTATTDRNGNETRYVYDSQDRLVTVEDPLGLETNLTYGSGGNLERVTDPAGRSSLFTQTASGRLIEIRDPEDQPTRYDYDEQSRLTSETSERDLTTIISYGAGGRYAGSELADGTAISLSVARTLGLPDLGEQTGGFVPLDDRMTTVTDGRGNVTETEVNEFGSPIRVVDALGRETIYERNDRNLVIAVIQPSSVTSSGTLRMEMTYDGLGNLTSQTEAVGTSFERTTRTEYETEFSRPVKHVDADGFETIMEYDEFGNRTRTIDPIGGEELMSYDERGRVLSITDKNGNVTEFEYDNFSRLEFTTDASNIRQQLIRDDSGNVIETIDDVDGPEERRTLYSFDDLNREITMTAADGGVTTYVYDGNDNVTSTTDPTGIVETRSYDDRDRLETINDPASGTTVFTYDEDSNILRMTDALGETTEFTYDAVDRLLSSIDAKGQLRAFAYDSRDNITAVTDARANMTLMGYDELDRPTARTNPKGEQWSFAYDARDNRTSATKPDGVVLLSDYDGLSRLTRISGGDIERTYAYDPQSNLLAANDNLNGVAGPDLGFSYDQENRLGTASVTNLFGNAAQNNLFTYTYDALDRRASMADSFAGNTAYAYDPVDRLTQVTTPQGEVFTTNYDLAGRMLGRAAPNTTVTTRTYEAETGRLASQTQAASDTAFNGFTYDYTDRGNIGEIAETGTTARTKRYSYDELERLTEVAVPESPTQDETYTLDPEGNRLSSHLSDTGETDVANRLTGDDAYSYVYDLNGNLLTKTAKPGVNRPDWAYAYDALDQLISVSRDGIEVERYRYDAFGRRSVIETANDNAVFERTAIVNDGSDRTIDLVQMDDGAGGTTAQIQNRYTHGGQVDEPLSLEVFEADGTLDQAYTYHADHLGSIRFVTDSVGNIANAYEYDSYGRPGFEVELVAQPFRYTGREWDQTTELYHYRARQYDPETGKFLQEDPIGLAEFDPNPYRYAYNNPILIKDPTGYSPLLETGTLAQATAVSGGAANLGIFVNCVFASIAASVEAEADLTRSEDGKLGTCSAELVNNTIKTAVTAVAAGVVAEKIPVLNEVYFRFIAIGSNTYRYVLSICRNGDCETRVRVLSP